MHKQCVVEGIIRYLALVALKDRGARSDINGLKAVLIHIVYKLIQIKLLMAFIPGTICSLFRQSFMSLSGPYPDISVSGL